MSSLYGLSTSHLASAGNRCYCCVHPLMIMWILMTNHYVSGRCRCVNASGINPLTLPRALVVLSFLFPIGGWGVSPARRSFRFVVRASVRVVWLPSGFRFQTRVPNFSFLFGQGRCHVSLLCKVYNVYKVYEVYKVYKVFKLLLPHAPKLLSSFSSAYRYRIYKL